MSVFKVKKLIFLCATLLIQQSGWGTSQFNLNLSGIAPLDRSVVSQFVSEQGRLGAQLAKEKAEEEKDPKKKKDLEEQAAALEANAAQNAAAAAAARGQGDASNGGSCGGGGGGSGGGSGMGAMAAAGMAGAGAAAAGGGGKGNSSSQSSQAPQPTSTQPETKSTTTDVKDLAKLGTTPTGSDVPIKLEAEDTVRSPALKEARAAVAQEEAAIQEAQIQQYLTKALQEEKSKIATAPAGVSTKSAERIAPRGRRNRLVVSAVRPSKRALVQNLGISK